MRSGAIRLTCGVLVVCAGAAGQTGVTIEEAAARALEHNLLLMAERLNIELAEVRAAAARIRPNPVLAGAADHLDVLGTGFSEDNGGGPGEYSLRLDWTLERGGKRRARVEVARVERSVAASAAADAARKVVLEAQQAWLEVLLARSSVEHTRESLESVNRLAEINRARLGAGDLSKVEFARTELAALQFQNEVRREELRLKTARARLASMMGDVGLAGKLEVAGDFRREDAPPERARVLVEAFERRPDLQGARAEMERAASDVKLQLANGRPDWTVGSEYRRQQGVNGKSNSVGFFVERPLAVFDRNQGEIGRARIEQRQAGLKMKSLEREVALEVETAWEEARAAMAELEQVEKTMLGRAREVRDITGYSYKRGDASLLEYLDAERAYRDTMQAYREARAAVARTLYVLDSVSARTVTK